MDSTRFQGLKQGPFPSALKSAGGHDQHFGRPGIFSRFGKNSLSLKQLPGPGKDPGAAATIQVWPRR